MRLILVRHGPAGDGKAKAAWAATGRPDAERPLTAEGREKMRRAARGIAWLADGAQLIASSPLARAKQTAELLRERLRAPLAETGALAPSAEPAELLRWLAGRPERTIVLAGHEPQLGRVIAWLCAGGAAPFTELKKGQACLLELRERRAGRARLIWSVAPAELRRLGAR